MVVKEKLNPKKWEIGDTFYIKIENNEKYKGRYLLFTKVDVTTWGTKTCFIPIFLVRITQNDILPQTNEELENLEAVKTNLCFWENRFWPMHGNMDLSEEIRIKSQVPFYPDEYGYLHTNRIAIVITRKSSIPEEFNYLGNFIVQNPKEEYIPFSTHNVPLIYREPIEEELIDSYEAFNKRNSQMYRVSYAMEKRSEWRNTNVLMNKYFKKDEEEYMKQYNVSDEKEVIKKIKEVYKRNSKKYKEEQEVLRETYKELVEYLLSIYNMPMVFITLAKLQLKKGILTEEVKKNALESIEIEQEEYKNNSKALKKLNQLEELKKKLINF